MQPELAAGWLVEHLHDREHGERWLQLLPRVTGPATVNALLAAADDPRLDSEALVDLTREALERDSWRFVEVTAGRRGVKPDGRRELVALLLEVEAPGAVTPLVTALEDTELPLELRIEIALHLGEHGTPEVAGALLGRFERCEASERRLAAACLIGLWRLEGEATLLAALDEAPRRTQRNLLSILRRRGRDERLTPSIYKLARELKPFLSERDSANRRSST